MVVEQMSASFTYVIVTNLVIEWRFDNLFTKNDTIRGLDGITPLGCENSYAWLFVGSNGA